MEYRRDESFIRQPPRDPYENMDRSRCLIRRSMSPQELQQDVGARQRSGGSVERIEYGWVVDRSGRASRVRSRSPPAMLLSNSRKRPQYDKGVGNSPGNYFPTPLVDSRQRRERGDMGELKNLKFDDNAESHGANAFGYDPSDPRSGKMDFDDVNFSAGDKCQFDGQDSILAQGSYESHSHRSRTSASINGVSGGKLPPFSRGLDTQTNFEQGRVQYHEVMDLDRLPGTHSYEDEQKPAFQTREVAYQVMPGSKTKGFLNPPEMSRNECLAFQDGVHFPQKNEFKGSGKLSQPMNSGSYRERSILDSGRAPEGSQRSVSFYPGEYSPDIDKGEDEDYFYLRRREVVDNRGYDMHELAVAPRDQLNYGRTQIIYDDVDISRPTRTHAFVDRNDNIDGSGGNLRRGIKYYRPATKDQTDPDHIDMRRQLHASKRGGEYLGPRFTQVEIAEDHELMHMSASKNQRVSYKEDYVSEDDLDRQFRQERLPHSHVSKYRTEMNRHNVGVPDMRDAHGMYKPQNRVVKGKYRIQDETSSYNPRKRFLPKMYSGRQFEELHESDEEWVDEEMCDVDTSRTRGFQQPRSQRTTERNYDGGSEGREAFVSDEWVSSQEVSHARKLSVGAGFNKPYNRHIRGNRRVGYTTRHNSQQFDDDRKDQLYRHRNGYDRRNQMLGQNNYYDRNNHVNRHQKIWNRNKGRCDNRFGGCGNNNDNGQSEDWVGPEESVLAEDSEEFKQLVHDAFLKFSRMLNGSLAVQRRYKEEGKAGSLFCVVCGRSVSKEFMDTRRLVTHAFMSHKTGLRADHLGLLKAICVMLGWSNVIPKDTITWVPQVLPQEQALAQKEDLILWPPVVVIYNISLSDKNPEKWKVITVEALETFIRGKGLIRGRVKVVLGKPADQSVMVVKFLGTFSGLGDAEKIHKYFVENNHGRLDVESKIASEISVNNEAETVEEKILYGYIGISEDLDRVDFSTRNTGLIKSKIDILDLANAPVKAEETKQ